MQTFEQILDSISELPIDQQELLVEIVSHRVAGDLSLELISKNYSSQNRRGLLRLNIASSFYFNN